MGFFFAAHDVKKNKKVFCRQGYSNCMVGVYNINKPSLPFFEHLLTAVYVRYYTGCWRSQGLCLKEVTMSNGRGKRQAYKWLLQWEML